MATTDVQASAPNITTMNSDANTQALIMQAMLSNMKAEQAAPIQAALALQARKAANKYYMENSIRRLAPALTNGITTQPYNTGAQLTFNLNTALNGYCEGLMIKYTVNYTLAAGTSAVYGLTAAGKLGLIDSIEVRYNKSQIKMRPQLLRQLSLLGALDEWTIPDQVLVGQQDTYVQNWVNTSMPVAVGANTVTQEFFLPFNLISPTDARGVLPLMAGDTGIQVIVNTPQGILGNDAVSNSIYAVSGTGHAISAVSGTVAIQAVYRDGDTYSQLNKLPFDISALDGTFQMQMDQQLLPLVANTVQRTKLNIMGYHYYVILLVVDGVSPSQYSASSNITYIESTKDGVGGNVFWKYGAQTNLDYRDWLFLNRLGGSQDLDQGVVPMIQAPTKSEGNAIERSRQGKAFLDNTRNGWSDWRYGVQVGAVGSNGTPRIEPHVFYINPTGLVPV